MKRKQLQPTEVRVSARITAELKERLAKACKLTGIDESTMVRKSIEALVEYVEENEAITFPLTVLPRVKKDEVALTEQFEPSSKRKTA